MKKQIIVNYESVSWEQLDQQDRELIEKAKTASLYSYAPFSQFHVGCAVRLDNGIIITGNNQENASFPCGTCAERSAIFYAHSNYPDHAPTTIAITARQQDGNFIKQPLPPCGACRQALLEMEHIYLKPMRILLYSTTETFIISRVQDLLPLQFTASMMEG